MGTLGRCRHEVTIAGLIAYLRNKKGALTYVFIANVA